MFSLKTDRLNPRLQSKSSVIFIDGIKFRGSELRYLITNFSEMFRE